MILVHISDPHVTADGLPVHGLVDADAALTRVVADINALDPPADVVVVTGDVTHAGEAKAARRACDILAQLTAPVWVAAGNHDCSDHLLAVFAPFPNPGTEPGKVDYAVDNFPLRLLFLDASTPDPMVGEITPGQLSWLQNTLDAVPDDPVVLCVHHAPFDTGIDWLDAIGIQAGRHELGEICRAHGGVVAILCGHLHRPMAGTWYGVPVFAAPSVMDQVTFTGRHPDGSPILGVMAPPGYVVHTWDAGQGLSTALRYLNGHTEDWQHAVISDM